MSTLDYIAEKFGLDLNQKSPISILKTNRTIMAQTLAELGFTVGAEIGVARGKHAELLSQNIPGLKLYCIDAWQGYGGYRDYSTARLRAFHKDAVERLANYNAVIVEKFSMEAVKQFDDGSLDFVYIDGAHDIQSVINDIHEWQKKVRLDGIVYGHDYKRSTNPRVVHHVKDAVPAYCYAYRIKPWFVLGEKGHHDGHYREGTLSWMFVKR